MNIDKYVYESGLIADGCWDKFDDYDKKALEKCIELVVMECIDKIETHKIPVGQSPAGEMACEWTYGALKTIRDEIKEHFGME